jgi:putative ABC transport system permease protein
MPDLLRVLPLIAKQIRRRPLRSALTLCGIAVAMFLHSTIDAMRDGVERATRVTAEDSVLVVYRENRYCPFTSRLPQYYGDRIEAIDGVARAIPMKIKVSNCRASLDVVTFRGAPPEQFVELYVPDLEIIAGSVDAWLRRSDAALVGEALATRRRVVVGDRLDAAGITVTVAGIIRSDEPQDENVAYTHLSFLQETSQRGGTGGVVTQFQVKVTDPTRMEEVARAIDAEFARDPDPTATRPEKAFVAATASDVIEIVEFASWLGRAALIAVFALIANSIALAVRDRVREHAILETVGFTPARIAGLIVIEGSLLGLVGGGVGALGSLLLLRQRPSIGMEGLTVEFTAQPGAILLGLFLAVALGLAAGLLPAIRAARRPIAGSFRAV